MAEKRAFVTIAVLGVAALLGQSGSLALLAGIAVPLDRMIDLVFERHDRHRRQRLRTLCGCLADELDRMVPADADTREAVRLEAERLLDRFGPSDKAFVEHHGMKAGSVADALLGHTSWSKLDLMENETSLRRVLTCFYDRLPVQAELFADLLPFIHRAHFATSRDTNAVVHELRERLVAQERDRAREFGIKEGMLIALARRYAEGSPDDFDAALAGLERALEVAREERERGRLPSNVSEAVDAVFARIDAHNDEGDLEAGQAVLDAELASMDEEDARRRAERARLYDKGIAQAILSRNVANASRFTLAKLDLEAPPDPQEAFVALRAAQDEWYERGCDKGLNFDLEVAIALARTALARATDADQRGAACNDFGTALSTLGERKSGTARLEEAITAYGSALKELNRERVPFQWATAQNNLGNALRALGQRESGTARLREAVIAYRKALEEWTRERVPLQWATAQNNLGNALRALGQRESGTARLHEAVTAYGDALQERTRERAPFDWAMTQNNLGTALQTLGERESGMTRLEDAVTAYRAALEELTRERVPLQWAGTQNNLGTALATLGQRESDTARLEEAVTAYRNALEEWTRERVPLQWAGVQHNLGNALRTLGERESDTVRLEEAVIAFGNALKERTRERVPLHWAATQNNLGKALATLGERRGDRALLAEALEAVRNAREIFVEEAGQTHLEDEFEQMLDAIEAALRRVGG